jgi:hypothetical protein
MKVDSIRTLLLAAGALAGLAACEGKLPNDVAQPSFDAADSGLGDSSGTTTLTVSKTATGFAERQRQDSWWIGKSVSPPSDTVLPGQSDTLSYTIAIVRSPGTLTDVYGVRGRICIGNTGPAATDSLILDDHVQYRIPGDTALHNLYGGTISGFPASLTLAPGDTSCFDYEYRFTPVSGATYRNVVQASIDNYAGHPGVFFGPEATADFTLPDGLETMVYDTSAVVTDYRYCPPGFSCTPSDSGPWYVSGDDTLRLTSTLHNDSAPCGAFEPVWDGATLTTAGGMQLSATDSAIVYTGDCSPGCTRTALYWLAHAGVRQGSPDLISPLLPIRLGLPPDTGSPGARGILVTTARQAAMILRDGLSLSQWNGIARLQAQLLAAKLNARAGASTAAVTDIISAADGFLTTYDTSSWSRLTIRQRARARALALKLEEWNVGLAGPGRCTRN